MLEVGARFSGLTRKIYTLYGFSNKWLLAIGRMPPFCQCGALDTLRNPLLHAALLGYQCSIHVDGFSLSPPLTLPERI